MRAVADNEEQYSCQTLNTPRCALSTVLITYNDQEYGAAQAYTRIVDARLDALAVAYARALASEGALGPVNVSIRKDRRGEFKAQEINLRNTGSTLARFILGMDELYLIARDFVPGAT